MIENIIFDLGGVIIDIQYKKTSEAFVKLGALNFDEFYTQAKQSTLFDDFDIGKITADEFRAELRRQLDLVASDKEIDAAWNAMLLDLPKERLELIKSLRETSIKTFLFSNTNCIHITEVFAINQRQNGFDTFKDYFDKEYYSHIFGKRKPHPEAFLALLKEQGLDPKKTLFIDDSLQHVLGAREARLHAVHITDGKTIFDTPSFIEEINKQILKEEKEQPCEKILSPSL